MLCGGYNFEGDFMLDKITFLLFLLNVALSAYLQDWSALMGWLCATVILSEIMIK
jgi:hypothetical protein